MATAKRGKLSAEDVEKIKKLEQSLRGYPSALSYGDYERCIAILSEAIRTTASHALDNANDATREHNPFIHRQAGFYFKRAKIYFKSGELKLAFDDCAAIRRLDSAYPNKLSIYSAYLLPSLQLEALILILIGNDKRAKRSLDEIVARVEAEPGEDNSLEELVRTVLPKSSSLLMIPNLSAMKWHSLRREFILHLFPEVAQLFENSKNPFGRSFWSKHLGFCLATLLMAISTAHFTLALMVAWYGSTFTMLACSCSVGAVCAYGIQALNHDLCHVRRHRTLNATCMILASSLCNFPWAMYYREYHQRHHAQTGTEYDRDGDILFQPWQSPLRVKIGLRFPRIWRSSLNLIRWFQYFEEESVSSSKSKQTSFEIDFAETPIWRFLWTVVFSWGIYGVFHIRKYQFDTFHFPQLKYEGLWLFATLILLRLGGVYSILYLWWSSAFSLGAFGHPYLGFWLIQHAAKRRAIDESTLTAFSKLSVDPVWTIRKLKAETFQPTFSSLGLVENLFNFGELQHVEHHDFPMIPAVRYHYLNTKAAPEFYQNLGTCPSVMRAIYTWLVSNDSEWMVANGDFAGREHYLTDGFEDQRDAALFYNDQR